MVCLRYLINLHSQQEEGFTLIEILMVVIIISVLSAISLPSMLNQANKARQSEAITNIGAMNKAQQIHFTESFEFTTNINDLGVGISPGNGNYTYEIQAVNLKKAVSNVARSNHSSIYSFVGVTGLAQLEGRGVTNMSVVCRENKPTGGAIAASTTTLTCPTDFERVE